MSAVKDLVIRAVSLAGQPLTHAMAARFDAHGGTLGRSDSNTLALPDPRRHISRLQAEVVLQGAQYVLRNAGNANPIAVNHTSLPPGASAPLAHGDEVQIGGYVLRVTLEAPQARSRTGTPDTAAPTPVHTVIMASAAEPKTFPRRAPSQLGGPATVGLGDLHAPLYAGTTDPFADWPGHAESPPAPAACAEPVDGAPSVRGVSRQPADAAHAPAVRATPAPTATSDAHALWRAFERGAGIDALPDEARTPELMATIGRVLRASVDGTLRVMAARGASQQDPRAHTTAIGPADHNPLTLDGQNAVQQLLFDAAFVKAYEEQLDALALAQALRGKGSDVAPPADATLPDA